jgi:DNA damage-inducible protein 1
LALDPYNVEAQKKIEELIRQKNIADNLELALEYTPESFGQVTMIYIPCEINGVPLKALVDCGAQTTISMTN